MAKTEAFDEHSERYEDWFEKNEYAYLSEVNVLKHLTPLRERSIEIGIGSGNFALPLGIKLGVEPSKPMRDLARAKGLQVLDGVAESLPFQDQTFHLVLMVTTICFVDDLKASFVEAHRVLKEDGLLLLGFVDRSSPLGKTYEHRKHRSVFYREANFYSTAEVLALLAETDFHIETVLQTVFGNPRVISTIQDFKEGHGEGGFVAIQARA